MYGPESKGLWSSLNLNSTHSHLTAGKKYTVSKAFMDFDKDLHPVGETWIFIGSSFLPYDDGLSLFVSLDGEHEWQIRMQWRPEEQGQIIDDLQNYIQKT